MSTIFGDGGIRRAPEPRPRLPADALTRAGELARNLAAMLDERNAQGPQETARLLVEVGRLPAEAQEAFLAAASPESGPQERAEGVRERIAQAYPETSDRRRELGAALVSVEGGEPGPLATSVLEAKVTLAKLGAVVSSARTLSADTMERARGFGLFGGSPAPPVPTPPPPTGPEGSAAILWRVDDVCGSVQQVARLASPAAALRTEADAAVPATWQEGRRLNDWSTWEGRRARRASPGVKSSNG